MSDNENQLENIKIENKETEMVERLRDVPKILSQLNGTVEREFSGPLPLEVLQNLSQENKDKLVNNFINQETKEHEANMKVLELIGDKNNKDFSLKRLSLIIGIPGFLILTGICLFSGNKDVLLEILKITFAFLGGAGFGYYIKRDKDSERS